MKLPIQETFYAWQGEGIHQGRSAFFIRTYGCPVHCPWCDSAGTWHPDYKPEKLNKLSVSDLLIQVKEANPEIVIITGGEPAIHDLSELTQGLKKEGYPSHLETSGGFELKGEFDWVTLSPKIWKKPLAENLMRADEIKIIVETSDSISDWWHNIKEKIKTKTIWLHPEWSQRKNSDILNAINDAVKSRQGPFRAGYQLHKIYQVDQLDPRSAELVPLGGDENLGY